MEGRFRFLLFATLNPHLAVVPSKAATHCSDREQPVSCSSYLVLRFRHDALLALRRLYGEIGEIDRPV
jgi:hypothetical protein